MTTADIIGNILYVIVGAAVTYMLKSPASTSATPAVPATPLLPAVTGSTSAANLVAMAEQIALSVVHKLAANQLVLPAVAPAVSAPATAAAAASIPYPVSLTLSDGHTVSIVNGVLTVTQTAAKTAATATKASPTIAVSAAA